MRVIVEYTLACGHSMACGCHHQIDEPAICLNCGERKRVRKIRVFDMDSQTNCVLCLHSKDSDRRCRCWPEFSMPKAIREGVGNEAN